MEQKFDTIKYPSLENMTMKGCPCCGDPFNVNMRPELTGKCHTGPVFVSYWEGELYLECGVCRKPICKIAVDRSLI